MDAADPLPAAGAALALCNVTRGAVDLRGSKGVEAGDAPFSSLASVSQPFWARFDGDRIPNVQPSSRYVRVRLKSKRLRIASHPTIAAVRRIDAGVHAAVRAAHAALGRLREAGEGSRQERVDVASTLRGRTEDDAVASPGSNMSPACDLTQSSEIPVRELDMMDDDEDEGDMLGHGREIDGVHV